MRFTKIEKVLLGFDCDPHKNKYAPAGFNERKLLDSVMGVKLDIEKDLELELCIEGLDQYQDGALFTALYHSEDNSIQKSRLYFSCFGRLATMDSRFPWCTNKKPITMILEQHGFIYVDLFDLERPYTGENHFSSQFSWFDRYFNVSF